MNLSRRAKRAIVALGVLAALVGLALLWLPEVAARQLTRHYLAQAGVTASFGNVDVDVFSGTVVFEDGEGQGEAGDGFSVGRLLVSIDYAPLLSKRLHVSRLVLEDAAADIRRTADNTLRVAGVPVAPNDADDSQPLEWGLALQQLTLGKLRLHYRQPANGDQPAVDRELVLNESSARDVVTWQKDNDVPLDADMRVDDSHLRVQGRITPFGDTVSGHFEIETTNFELDLLSPITRAGGLQRLTGTVDSKQQIDVRYDPAQDLTLAIDGKADWRQSALALANGLTLSGERFNWQGALQFALLRPDGQPGTLTSDGQLQATAMALNHGDAFSLTQASGDWQGRTALTLAADATRIDTDGTLIAKDLDLNSNARETRLQTPRLDWQGQTNVRVASRDTTITGDGALDADHLTMTVAGGTRIDGRDLHWQGENETTLGNTVAVDNDGRLRAQILKVALAGDSRFQARALDWQGTVATTAADDLQIDSDGTLKADDAGLRVPGSLDLNMAPLSWNGAIDVTANQRIRVRSDGGLDSGALTFAVPATATFEADAARYNGTMAFDIGAQFARRMQGRLIANHARLALPGQPLALSSERIVFNGDYSEQPGDGTGLRLRVAGDIASQAFALTNTAIGALDSGALTFAVPATATFEADAARYNGTMAFDIGAQFARRMQGRLIANHARLALPGQPLALSSERIVFNGDYSEQPGDGTGLRLRVAGDIASQAFALTHTAIGAPWIALRDAELDNLAIDGLNAIAFDKLQATGVRFLGDNDTSAAVLDATNATARGFALDDLRDYRLSNLDIDGADIHVRRDASGMGVMALYFGGENASGADAAGASDTAGAPSTYAIDHLTLTGPSIGFTDVAVSPPVQLSGSALELTMDGLDTASPEQDANYRLALDVGEYGHLDSRGTIAPLASGGMNMDLDAWMRSLALAPMSGYLNAAMGRRIARGVADGTLNLEATDGQLDGNLDTTLSNFRLVDTPGEETEIVFGISMDTALSLVRGQDDTIQFETAILGDVTNPYFSIRNLVREAVLAGLRTTIMSDYSPLGLLNKAKNALLNLGRSLVSKPVVFVAGKHYIQPDDRGYLGNIAQSMREKPGLRLTVQANATPQDADAMSLFGGDTIDSGNIPALRQLADSRASAVRDYLAARDVPPDRITLADSVIDRAADAQPRATFSLTGK